MPAQQWLLIAGLPPAPRSVLMLEDAQHWIKRAIDENGKNWDDGSSLKYISDLRTYLQQCSEKAGPVMES